MTKDNKKISIINVLIILMIFSCATLYKSETINLFYSIIILSIAISCWYFLKNINVIKQFVKTRFFIWLTLIFIMYFIYGMIFEVYDNYNPERLIAMYAIIIDIALLVQCINKKKMIEEVIKCFSISAILIVLYIIVNEFQEIINGATRIGNTGTGNVNTIGIYLGMLSIGLCSKAIINKEKKDLILYLIICIFMFLTGSKKAILIILITILVTYMIKNKFDLLKYIKPVIIIVFIMTILFTNEYFYNIIGFRIEDFINELTQDEQDTGTSYSTEQRMLMYKKFPKLFINSPIIGNGWGYFTKFSGLNVYSHCNYIEMLVTFGLFGTILYYEMYIRTLKSFFKVKKSKDDALQICIPMISLITILICDFSSVSFNSKEIYYIYLFIALYQLKILKEKKEEENEN